MKRRTFLAGFGTFITVGPPLRPAMAQSARQYGVIPDLTTDQSVAFQRMITQASARNQTIDLPAGTYAVSNIQLPSNCRIEGRGASLVSTSRRPILHANDVRNVSLSGFTIQGVNLGPSEATSGLIDFRRVTSLKLDELKIHQARHDAIYLEQVSGNVSNCTISSAGRFGIFTMESLGINITNNGVSNCGDGGIIVHRWSQASDGTLIANNKISTIDASRGGTGQWGNGINVFRADNTIIENNVVSDCAFSAIRMNTAYDTKISRNTCLRSGETAIYAEFAYRDASIIENTIDGAANGISATNLNNGGAGSIIKDNAIRNITAPGPYKPEAPYFGHGISVEADSLVTGNNIENANGYGINIGWGPYLRDVNVIGNTIINAEIGIGVSKADGAGRAAIMSNKINARSGAIRAHQWADIDKTDLLQSKSAVPSNVEIENNVSI